jgi:hypothetical protein
MLYVGRESAVGIATCHGLYGPWIESRWWRDFPLLSRPILGPTQPSVLWVPGHSWGVKRPGRGLNSPPPSSAEIKEKVEYTPALHLCFHGPF